MRAYLASTSFMDSQVGRVLEALETSGRADNTIVVLWSDHGWHLGEKLITGKNSLWERSTHVPLIFAGPDVAEGGRCRQPVELLDIFPTLLDLTGLPARADLEGHSLVPQLKDADARAPLAGHHHPQPGQPLRAHSTLALHPLRRRLGRTVRRHKDPNEWTNLAKGPEHAARKADLAKWLPKIDKPAVPGSAIEC